MKGVVVTIWDNRRGTATTAVVATVSSVLLLQAGLADPGSASMPVLSKAHMSDYHPRDYATIDVYVKTKEHAKVTTTADTSRPTRRIMPKANGHGEASIEYEISRATPGYKVHVDVTVKKHGKTGSCSTWFTPRS